MNKKLDPNSTSGEKLLKMYQILFADNKPHYQTKLAQKLNCSKPTVIRLAQEIEKAFPLAFKTGIENKSRWYKLEVSHPNFLG